MKSQYPIGLHINKLSRLISRKVDAAVLSAIDDNITVSSIMWKSMRTKVE